MLVVFIVLGGIVGGLYGSGVLPPGSDSGKVSIPASATPANVVKVHLSPGEGAQLQSPQGKVVVEVESGTVDANGQLWYNPLASDQIPQLPAQFVVTDIVFDLSLFGSPRVSSPPPKLKKELVITVHLSERHVAIANGQESNLVIQYFNERRGLWSPLTTTVDFSAATAQIKILGLSIFALTIKQPSPGASVPSPTPALDSAATPEPTVTPEPEPSATPTIAPPVTNTPVPTPTSPAPDISTATPAPSPTAVPTEIPTPTPTPIPVFDGIYFLTVDQPLDRSYAGKSITFKIDDLTAGEVAIWQQGETNELNLTASSTTSKHTEGSTESNPTASSRDSRGTLLASPLRQPVPPPVFQGTVSIDGILAPEGTIVTAWIDDGEVASTAVIARPAAPESISGTGLVFGPLGNDLNYVWQYDALSRLWSFYDPRPEFAATSTLTDASSGDIVWINVAADVEFQGITLHQGWNLIAVP